MADQNGPNPAANRDPAEGSRDALDRDDRGTDERYSDENERADEGGGITNRPLSRERAEQREVPDRGDAKPGGHAS